MARIVVISADPMTRASVIAALAKEHDTRAFGDPWRTQAGSGRSSGEVREQLLQEHPALLIVDADVLLDPTSTVSESVSRSRPQTSDRTAVRMEGPAVLVLIEPGQEHLIVSCFDAGADDYVIKPFEAHDLRARVRRVVTERAAGARSDITDPIAISDDGRFLRTERQEEETDIQAHLGRYEVRGVLGRGGYGVVYRARDLSLDRDVALKVLPRDMVDNAEAVTRFLRESTAISRLDHPNIIKFYEMGCFRGRLYFTMELVEGRTLKDVAEREAPLSVARATRYVAEIAKALEALDSIGLVHRDVKPENVLITRKDEVKLIDFGLVRMRDMAAITSQDDVLGTPYFMAPEYIRAPGVPDIRYDLYALGITYFHLLSGEYPFDGKNAAHVMEKHLRCQPPRISVYQPGVPLEVEQVIGRLLEKEPERRTQTPRQFLAQLQPIISGGRWTQAA